jgi:hypothetical protein
VVKRDVPATGMENSMSSLSTMCGRRPWRDAVVLPETSPTPGSGRNFVSARNSAAYGSMSSLKIARQTKSRQAESRSRGANMSVENRRAGAI